MSYSKIRQNQHFKHYVKENRKRIAQERAETRKREKQRAAIERFRNSIFMQIQGQRLQELNNEKYVPLPLGIPIIDRLRFTMQAGLNQFSSQMNTIAQELNTALAPLQQFIYRGEDAALEHLLQESRGVIEERHNKITSYLPIDKDMTESEYQKLLRVVKNNEHRRQIKALYKKSRLLQEGKIPLNRMDQVKTTVREGYKKLGMIEVDNSEI